VGGGFRTMGGAVDPGVREAVSAPPPTLLPTRHSESEGGLRSELSQRLPGPSRRGRGLIGGRRRGRGVAAASGVLPEARVGAWPLDLPPRAVWGAGEEPQRSGGTRRVEVSGPRSAAPALGCRGVTLGGRCARRVPFGRRCDPSVLEGWMDSCEAPGKKSLPRTSSGVLRRAC
jgi:hypothetical protein